MKKLTIIAGAVAATIVAAAAGVALAQSGGAVSAALADGTVGEQADGYLGIRGKVSDEVRVLGDLKIDLPKHKITYRGKAIDLTTIEFNIVEYLSRQPGRVFSRDQIMDNVWNEGKFIVDRAVDVHIRGLRKKMEDAADLIETVRGVGYRFKDLDDVEQ